MKYNRIFLLFLLIGLINSANCQNRATLKAEYGKQKNRISIGTSLLLVDKNALNFDNTELNINFRYTRRIHRILDMGAIVNIYKNSYNDLPYKISILECLVNLEGTIVKKKRFKGYGQISSGIRFYTQEGFTHKNYSLFDSFSYALNLGGRYNFYKGMSTYVEIGVGTYSRLTTGLALGF